MSQGKAWDKDKIINEVLKELFQLGYSVTKACDIAGIPPTTVQTWIEADEILRAKITKWQNEPNILARKQWIKAISTGIDKKENDSYTPAKDWLERREKSDFSTRTENTGKDGKDLIPQFVVSTKESKEELEKLYKDANEGSDSTND